MMKMMVGPLHDLPAREIFGVSREGGGPRCSSGARRSSSCRRTNEFRHGDASEDASVFSNPSTCFSRSDNDAAASSGGAMTQRRDDDEVMITAAHHLQACHEDILFCVVEFLDLASLSSWSETNRRINGSCRSYLGRQLRQPQQEHQGGAENPPPMDDPSVSSCLSSNEPTLEHLHQLSRLDNSVADRIIQEEFVQRKDMPQHRHHLGFPFDDDVLVAYRDKLAALPTKLNDAVAQMRATWQEYSSRSNNSSSSTATTTNQRKMAATAAAMLGTVACVAMASSCYHEAAPSEALAGSTLLPSSSSACHLPSLEFVEEIMTRLLKLGVMGTLMKGGAKAAAEAAARARTAATHGSVSSGSDTTATTADSVPTWADENDKEKVVNCAPTSLDVHEEPSSESSTNVTPSSSTAPSNDNHAMRGSVGAYRRVLVRCRDTLRSKVKESRKQKFLAIDPPDQHQQVALRFKEACSHDDVDAVKQLINQVDVDGFFVSHDGTTTCGLHSAAFHNSCRVVEYLVTSGCCDVNLSDANGWTALHFAAGANALEASQLLLSHGANDAQEAANGYTPLQWAERLQNSSVLPVLRKARDDRRQRWRRHHPGHAHYLMLLLLGEGFVDVVPHLLQELTTHHSRSAATAAEA